MVTRNTITDEYVVRPKIDDQASPGIDAFVTKLGEVEPAAQAAAAAAAKMGQQATETGALFGRASSQFDTYARKYDDVTAASARLAAAQRQLQNAVDVGTVAMQKGTATQTQYDATIAGMVQRISTLSTALGSARANAEANATAQARWNGEIGTGAQAAGAFADRVAATAEATKAGQIAMTRWLETAGGTSATFERANTNLASYTAGLTALRAEFDGGYAAQTRYQAVVDRVNQAVATAGLSEGLAAVAIGKAAAARDASLASLNGEAEALAKSNAERAAAAASVAAAAAAAAAYAASLDKLTAAYAPAFAAERAFADKQLDIKTLVDAGRLSMAAAGDQVFAASAQYDKLTTAAKATAAALRDTAEAARLQNLGLTVPQTATQQASNRSNATATFGDDLAAQAAQVDTLRTAEAALAQQKTLLTTLLANEMISTDAATASLAKYQAVVDSARRADGLAAEQATKLNASRRAEFDTVFAAQQTYLATLARIKLAVDEGGLSEKLAAQATTEAAAARAQAVSPAENLTNAAKSQAAAMNQTAFATRQMGVQTVQFASQLYAGAPPMLAFIQQAHQMVDVGLATGTGFEVIGKAVKSAWSAISSFTANNPALVALTAIVTISTVLIAVAESAAGKMNTLQQQIRGVSDDYKQLGIDALAASRAAASSSNIGSTDAFSAASAFVTAPGFNSTTMDLQALIKVADNAAISLGLTVPEAAKKLAGAILDVGPLAQELADKHLYGMNQTLADSIKLQVASGDAAGAYAKVLDIVTQKTVGGAQPATDLGKAWERLKDSFTGAADGGRSLGAVLGDALSAWAQTALRLINEVVNAMTWASNKIAGIAKIAATTDGASLAPPGS